MCKKRGTTWNRRIELTVESSALARFHVGADVIDARTQVQNRREDASRQLVSGA